MSGATEFSGRKILITGGAGGIGSNLTRSLADRGAEIVVLDDLSASHAWNIPVDPAVTFIKGSILDDQAVRQAFSFKPDFVFHLAALFANQNSIEHPEDDLMVNGLGTLRILQYAQITDVERVVYASSGCSIYGADAPLPLTEGFISDQLSTPYQITKMLGELYSNFFNNHYGLSIVKTRFFNSFGPGEAPGRYRNVIPNFIAWAMQGQPLPITGTGEETRDWTYVVDIVEGLLSAATVKGIDGESINLAAGKETRVIDMAKLVNEITGNEAGIEFLPRRNWDNHSRLLGSIEKAGDLLGYTPKTAFEPGLRDTVKWFDRNWDKILATTDIAVS
ncbi:MAG: NAD-dependent epimerase/dehydratase family protein [Chloroflexi bacterium]|nr:NAD-dependent epimerase/dehydratase family protein [Chloroflexota bacterium]